MESSRRPPQKRNMFLSLRMSLAQQKRNRKKMKLLIANRKVKKVRRMEFKSNRRMNLKKKKRPQSPIWNKLRNKKKKMTSQKKGKRLPRKKKERKMIKSECTSRELMSICVG